MPAAIEDVLARTIKVVIVVAAMQCVNFIFILTGIISSYEHIVAAATVKIVAAGGGVGIDDAAGAAYEHGLIGVIADPFGGALVFFIVGFFFVRLFRRLRLLTFIDFFENRYGKTAATIAAIASIASNIGWNGGLLVAFGYVFETLTGVPLEIGIIGGAVVVFIYTVAGGMWAVALTDFVQMIIMTVGLVLLLVVVLIDAGGWGNIGPHLPEGTFRMIPAENTAEVWLNYIRAWLIFGLADVTAQTLMQRAFSAKNEQVAQNSFYLAGFVYLSLGMIPVTLGIIASVTMPGLADPETVIPELAIAHLHPVAIAIFVGALLAAIMSTADSALLAAASIFSNNILPLFKPQASDRLRLLFTRAAIPIPSDLVAGPRYEPRHYIAATTQKRGSPGTSRARNSSHGRQGMPSISSRSRPR